MSFFEELKRRNVVRVAVAYIVASWVLLQVADLVLDAIKAPDWVIQSMLLFVVLGFIAAMIIAWAYEMTPEGLKRESEVDRSQSITNETAARLDRITIALLVAVVAIIAVERFVLAPPGADPAPAQVQESAEPTPVNPAPAVQATQENSVAVLPFVAMSSGEDDEYFADGLTEEILNSLAQLPELLVTARTSSFSFKGQDVPVTEIAEKLGVRHIVEGSVRRSGERLRVTAQLVRAADGFHLWSENYDSTSEDTIQVQEDIAEKIALAMDVVMDEQKREAMRDAGLRDVEAFIAMQKARELYQRAHGDAEQIPTLRAANGYYEQVLERVPGYPPALLEHSDLYVHILNDDALGIPTTGVTEDDIATAKDFMLTDVSTALENARNFTEQNQLEIDLSFLSGNWRGIEQRIQRYNESDHCDKPTWSPQFALPFGNAQAYAERIQQVVECDPLTTSNWFELSRAWLWAGDSERALEVVRRGMEVAPGGWLPYAHNWALMATRRFEEQNTAIETEFRFESDRLVGHISRLAAMGDPAGIPALLERFRNDEDYNDYQLQLVSARIGDRETANRIAAGVDQHIQGSQALALLIYWCKCGAPFDIEVTPAFAEAFEQTGYDWPPPSPIQWPLKDW
ncbi:MAG: hypothetical protein HKN15_11820 [Xanthomonadales bacterium]|nr:hypothetical protein [Xanthomonadales bacterium]